MRIRRARSTRCDGLGRLRFRHILNPAIGEVLDLADLDPIAAAGPLLDLDAPRRIPGLGWLISPDAADVNVDVVELDDGSARVLGMVHSVHGSWLQE
jgi:hypothetical protein